MVLFNTIWVKSQLKSTFFYKVQKIFVLFGWCMNRTTVLLESHAWSFNSMENSTQKRHVLLFMGHKNSCCEWHIKNGVGFSRRKIFLKVDSSIPNMSHRTLLEKRCWLHFREIRYVCVVSSWRKKSSFWVQNKLIRHMKISFVILKIRYIIILNFGKSPKTIN